MNGFALCLLVILAADAVRSQGPPTQTKKGTRPARPNDNTDRGLPSGADVPDGTRFAPPPTQTRAGPSPAGRPAAGPPPPPAGAAPPAAGRLAPPAAGGPAPPTGAAPVLSGPPPTARRLAPPAAPAGSPNDNADRGIPSGADVPDGVPSAAPVAPSRSATFFNYVAPAAPAAPAMSCEAYCDMTASYKPVCSIDGNQYDNDCLRECTGEPRQCENPCPCNATPSEPSQVVYADDPIVSECPFCSQEWDPVCIDNEETVQNECIAKCQGKTITCSSSCPC
ncbi:uncharacterized protein LOC127851405 [Dreissena polymorpha]|uniref:uncharacterized protein LOC127851405 n=1 Tax=Dreissena polymorpha TaxID=45954 RepID=UPI0022643705|nr:uncharacterized protein LOC127851405 [Dreissena polymorpha]